MVKDHAHDRHEIERAFFFLSNTLQDSGTNSKPVFLHTVEVVSMLRDANLSQAAVIAGVLHDIVEDTAITIEDVEREFGKQVALYVDALTLSDTQDIYQSIDRSVALSSDVLSIRAADLIQNSAFYHLAAPSMKQHLYDKFVYFMSVADGSLGSYLSEQLQAAYELHVKVLQD